MPRLMPTATSATAEEAPAEAADQVDHRVEQRDLLPRRRQHVDRIEAAAQEGQRRDDHQWHDLQLLEAVGPDAEDEAQQAEGQRGQHQEAQHPHRMGDGEVDEQPRRAQHQQPEQDRLAGRGADIAEHDLQRRHRRRQQFVDRAGELGHVDAEGGVGDALRQDRHHDQPRHDEGRVADAVDRGHARADGRAEDHEVQRGAEHRRGDALHQRAPHAGHLEAVDGADA